MRACDRLSINLLLSAICVAVSLLGAAPAQSEPDKAMIAHAAIGGAGLLEKWGKELEATQKSMATLVIGSSSDKAFEKLINGEASFALLMGKVTKDQKQAAAKRNIDLRGALVGRTGFAIITGRSNPVEALTVEQTRNIFNGKITSWSAVGGRDEPIRLLVKRAGGGELAKLFRQDILLWAPFASQAESAPSFISVVRRCAKSAKPPIGFVPLSLLESTRARDEVKVIPLKRTDDGAPVFPSQATVADFSYPAAGIPLYLYWNAADKDERVAKFAQYCISRGGLAKTE